MVFALKGCVARWEHPQFIRRSREGTGGRWRASRMNRKAVSGGLALFSRDLEADRGAACGPKRLPVPQGNRRCLLDRRVSLRGLAQFCRAAVGASPPFGPSTFAAGGRFSTQRAEHVLGKKASSAPQPTPRAGASGKRFSDDVYTVELVASCTRALP